MLEKQQIMKINGEYIQERMEVFCQLVVRFGSYTQAYQGAYECKNSSLPVIRVAASRLGNLPKVQRRIAAIRREAIDRMSMTPEAVVERHRQLYELARSKGDLTNATKNLTKIGETMGIYKDNLMIVRDLTDLTDDDVHQRITDALGKISDSATRRKFLLNLKAIWDKQDGHSAGEPQSAVAGVSGGGDAGGVGAARGGGQAKRIPPV